MAPPDPMPNSEVKRNCANGSVGIPHVRVGHRQVPFLSGNNSVIEPPDSMPNSEVKRNSVDDSVGLPCESRTSPGPNFKNKNTNKFKEFA